VQTWRRRFSEHRPARSEQHCLLGAQETAETRYPESASFRQRSDFVDLAGVAWPYSKATPDRLIFVLRIAAWKGNARTPGTFPSRTGVGGVQSFLGQENEQISLDNTIQIPTEPAYGSYWEYLKSRFTKERLKRDLNEFWKDADRRMRAGEDLPLVGGIAGAGSRLIRIGPRWRARAITDAACSTGCDDVAKQIQKHIGGEVKTIVPSEPGVFLGPYRGHDIMWGYHKVVVKDGRVYDAFTGHQGMAINDYKKLWQHADSIKFGF